MLAYDRGYAPAEEACNASSDEVTARQDLEPLTPEERVQWIDGVVDGVAANGRRIKGIRLETPTLQALGVAKDTQNSGWYRDVVVVEAHVDPLGSYVEIVVNPADLPVSPQAL